jgi:hypothetical protein
MNRVIYVAGPYTKPDPVANTHAAMKVWDRLFDAGLTPIVPHWSLFQHFLNPRPYEDWMEYDFAIIERCDALLRLPGVSEGADREVEFAEDRHIPVFYSLEDVYEWAGVRHG